MPLIEFVLLFAMVYHVIGICLAVFTVHKAFFAWPPRGRRSRLAFIALWSGIVLAELVAWPIVLFISLGTRYR